jgi:DNA-binding NtrC family response regulator
MNDLRSRVSALRMLLDDSATIVSTSPIGEAIVACCAELLDSGDYASLLELIDTGSQTIDLEPGEVGLRLDVMKARALTFLGKHEAALSLMTTLYSTKRSLLAAQPRTLTELRICEGSCLVQLNRLDEAEQKLLAVRAELLAGPDKSLLASCAFNLSSAELFRGNRSDARRYVLEAIVSARLWGSRITEANALENLGRIEKDLCRWSSAEEAIQQALAIYQEKDARHLISIAQRLLAIVEWKRGRLAEALTLAESCLQSAQELESTILEWYASLLKGMVLLHQGDYAGATQLFASGKTWEVPRSHSRPSLLTAEFLGDASLEQGRPDQALERYEQLWPKALALVPKGDIVAELRWRRAECYLLLGRVEQAYDEAKTGLDHCRELGDRYEEAATYRVLALAAAAIGRAHEAKQHFTQGFAYYDDIETPYEWGKLWMSYGDWLRGPHAAEFADPLGALEAYHAARDHFERMGAKAKLAEVSARIAEHGASLDPDRSSSPRRHAARKPRLSADLERRAAWAREAFGTVTRHPHLLSLLEDVAKLSKSDAAILVLGESGTGKELVADGIHRHSARRGAYMPLNCSALPREVIENELFGHVSGGFTGALRDKPGLFEVCDGGTIFLDEIAEMSLDLQSKLLRFLESGEVRRIGAAKNLMVDTRVVAATNRDRTTLENGEGLRKDLYYRLAQAVIELPALRHRGSDVGLLIDHFLDESCMQEQKRVSLSDAAWERLVAYPWPGNVRQLKAAMRRLVLLVPEGHTIAAGELKLDDTSIATSLLEEMEQSEKRKVIEALAQTRGSRTEAARMLGIPRTTLLNKIKRYGLT